MRVVVNIPFHASLELLDDIKEEELPNIGDRFDDTYIIVRKTFIGNNCILDTKRITTFEEKDDEGD